MSIQNLQEKIKAKAEARFEKELNEFVLLATSHPIMSKIIVTGFSDPKHSEGMYIFNRDNSKALFNVRRSDYDFLGKTMSNFTKIKDELIARYESEIAEDILKKVASIQEIYEDINELKDNLPY